MNEKDVILGCPAILKNRYPLASTAPKLSFKVTFCARARRGGDIAERERERERERLGER